MEDVDSVYKGLLGKIRETEQIIEECKNLPGIGGKLKLQRKIEAELRFLKRLTQNREKLKEEHIRSSNIYHLAAIVKCCRETQGVIKVLETFSYESKEFGELCEKSLVIDLVADYGKMWVKVATRNPHNLYQSSIGLGKYGRKSIVDQACDIVECAAQNQHAFAAPRVIVKFGAGVTEELKELLSELNVEVIGEMVGAETAKLSKLELSSCMQGEEVDFKSIDTLSKDTNIVAPVDDIEVQDYLTLSSVPLDTVLNLDVSTFLAYVSNMTNGHCHAQYKEKLLMDLSKMEQAHPVKPVLDQLFKDRKLVCCETAHKAFMEILTTVGGESEKDRATKMLQGVTVIPDNPSEKALSLEITSKIKERSRIVFGTGDMIKAVTVSANLGFLNAALSQGVKFVTFIHESRALTEGKELR